MTCTTLGFAVPTRRAPLSLLKKLKLWPRIKIFCGCRQALASFFHVRSGYGWRNIWSCCTKQNKGRPEVKRKRHASTHHLHLRCGNQGLVQPFRLQLSRLQWNVCPPIRVRVNSSQKHTPQGETLPDSLSVAPRKTRGPGPACRRPCVQWKWRLRLRQDTRALGMAMPLCLIWHHHWYWVNPKIVGPTWTQQSFLQTALAITWKGKKIPLPICFASMGVF